MTAWGYWLQLKKPCKAMELLKRLLMSMNLNRGGRRKEERKAMQIIDLFHNGDQISYSFVLMLISLISLTAMGKILKNI